MSKKKTAFSAKDRSAAGQTVEARPPILNAPGKVRIVGGLWKRTVVQVTAAPGLRPTPDRVREALFNWLGPSVKASVALDLFAGTGALGLEALSRGAAHVHFNDPHLKAMQSLKALLEKLQRPPAASWKVTQDDALKLITRLPPQSIDLVFLDPPFGQEWLERVLPILLPTLTPAARIYIEAEAWVEYPGLALLKKGQAGQVHYHLFQRIT
jgi:16S rRNA (guanine966-N2)-methyltransferase